MIALTILPVSIPANVYKAAATIVAETAGNRANKARATMLLAAAMTAASTGRPVEITTYEKVAMIDGKRVVTVEQSFIGEAATYNQAHRTLGTDLLVEYWSVLKVVPMTEITQKGKKITGTPNSTATGARVWFMPFWLP